MQDETQYRQSLVDRGWADMEARLDKAMPVRGRELNWYLLFLLLAAVLVVSGLLAVNYFDKKEQKPVVNTVPVAELHENEQSDTQDEETAPGLHSAEQPSGLPQESQVALTGVEPERTQSKVVQQYSSDARYMENSSNNGQLQSLEFPKAKRLPHKPFTFDEPEMASESLLNKKSLTGKIREVENVALIPAKHLSVFEPTGFALSDRTLSFASTIEPIVSRSGRKGITISLTAGLHADADVFANGYDAGIMVAHDLGRRWAVETGLLFGHYARNGLKLGASQADHSETLASYPGNAGLDPVVLDFLGEEESYRIISDLSDKYSYLHLPVNARFRLTPKMTLIAGPRFSYLLNAITENAPELYNNFTGQWEPQGKTSNLIYRHDFLRKFEAAALVGLEFQIGRSTALEIAYTHSFTHLVNRSSVPGRSDYLRTLRAGFEYQL